MKTAVIYTDGSCLSNPGPGGWAFAVAGHGCYSSGTQRSTNNEMELKAIVEAVSWATDNKYEKVVIHTDSNYCLQGATQWLTNWVNNHWKTAGGSRVKNEKLWKQYLKDSWNLKVEFVKVKAHSGDVANEYVDRKAREQAEKRR